MAYIYLCNIDKFENNKLEKILENISSEKAQKLSKLRHKEDVVRSAIGEKLLVHALKEKYSITEMKIKYGEYEKPYLDSCQVSFNLSHSDDRVVLILDTNSVGIDIEKMDDIEERKLCSFFAQEEQQRILNACDSKLEFYRTWTLKESYIKMLGLGLHKPLDSFWVKNEENKTYVYEQDNAMPEIYYSQCIEIEDYMMSYISHSKVELIHVDWTIL